MGFWVAAAVPCAESGQWFLQPPLPALWSSPAGSLQITHQINLCNEVCLTPFNFVLNVDGIREVPSQTMSGLCWASLGHFQGSLAHRKGANFDLSELADPNPSACGSSEAEPLLMPADSHSRALTNHNWSLQKLSNRNYQKLNKH